MMYRSQSLTQVLAYFYLKMLEIYRVYSGYVYDVQKTQVMRCNYTPTQEVIAKYIFKWYSPHIRYLRVSLPKDHFILILTTTA